MSALFIDHVGQPFQAAASRKPWSGPPAGNVGIPADVLHSATATDAGTTAGMAGQKACSTGRAL